MKNLLKRAPLSKGKTCYEKYLSGKKIGRREAMLAKCWECMGGYVDGRSGCEVKDCSLYPFYPYKSSKRSPDPT